MGLRFETSGFLGFRRGERDGTMEMFLFEHTAVVISNTGERACGDGGILMERRVWPSQHILVFESLGLVPSGEVGTLSAASASVSTDIFLSILPPLGSITLGFYLFSFLYDTLAFQHGTACSLEEEEEERCHLLGRMGGCTQDG